MEWRIESGGIAVLDLSRRDVVLAVSGSLVYRSGEISWSRVAPGDGWFSRWASQLRRHAAGLDGTMDRFAGLGRLAVVRAESGAMKGVDVSLSPLVVDRRCLVAMPDTVQAEVALQAPAGLRGGRRVVLLRLSGRGVAFVQAYGSSMEVELREGEDLDAVISSVAWFSGTDVRDSKAAVGGPVNVPAPRFDVVGPAIGTGSGDAASRGSGNASPASMYIHVPDPRTSRPFCCHRLIGGGTCQPESSGARPVGDVA